MSEAWDIVATAHAAADSLVAASCSVIAICFAVFARRNPATRLGPVFLVFAVVFATGGAAHVCEVGGWRAAGALFKSSCALALLASAVLTVKCLPSARTMFARVVVVQQRLGERLERLRSEPRYDTPEDRLAVELLAEIRDLARLAGEVKRPEEV